MYQNVNSHFHQTSWKTIDSNSGLLSEGGGRKEYFIVGTEPKRTYIAEMQERGYYVPPELQQRLNGGTGKSKTQFQQRNQKNYSNPDLNTKSAVNFDRTFLRQKDKAC